MARGQSNTRRNKRAADKLLEAAVLALMFGGVVIVAPLFVSNPFLVPMLAALRTLGWLALAAGAVLLLVFYKLPTRAATAPPPVSANRRSNPKAPENPVATAGSLVPDSASNASVPKSASPAADAPAVPTVWSASVFDVIEWRRFEALCECLFAQAGFDTNSQSHGADGGIDIWLYSKNYPDGPVSVVQCKHWATKPVKVSEVRALLGSMADKKVRRGIFATTSTFTPDASAFAKNNGIQTLDRAGLLELIAKRTAAQQQELLEVATKDEFWVPTCASCGIKMIRRERKAGGSFWGCRGFPKCRTTLNA